MEDYIPDGEIHPISKDWAAMHVYLKDQLEFSDNCELLRQLTNDFLKKYAEYLYNNDKEEVISLIIRSNLPNMYGNTSEHVQFIYRPPSLVNEFGTFALKFKRSPNDNLDRKDENRN